MFNNKIMILAVYIIIVINICYISTLNIESKPSIDEVMNYISSQIIEDIYPRQIKVYAGSPWNYLMIPSVSRYLFEDLNIIENLAPKGQINRPGNVYDKHYICVHDTGDPSFGAKQWSDIVKNAKIGERNYTSSFQYVVGNDGYYHNIPDNEIAYHAGDGHYEDSIFGLISSGVYVQEIKSEKPKIEIDKEGYYTINNEKSKIKAPTNEEGQILTTEDINDLGIYSELQKIDDNKYEYFLGRTWYNPIFGYISNYGGNLNSIGIETCVNTNTDVYYSWQKVAKLVAKLMEDNNFTIDAVVQHHYFSGKDCPQTKRTAGLWDYFKTIVLTEYQMLKYQKMGYIFEFKSESEYLNEKGRVIKSVKDKTMVQYNITVKDKEGNQLDKNFISYIYPE